MARHQNRYDALERHSIQAYFNAGMKVPAIKKLMEQLNPGKNYSVHTLRSMLKKIQDTGDLAVRRPGSGRRRSARTQINIDRVKRLICSQDDKPKSSHSPRKMVKNNEVTISRTSIRNIIRDEKLVSRKRIQVQVLTQQSREKRAERSQRLLARFQDRNELKKIVHTDEKQFCLNFGKNRQNNVLYLPTDVLKRNADPKRLLEEKAKFGKGVMVSAGVCWNGKTRLVFVDDDCKVNASYYTEQMLPQLIEDCHSLYPNDDYVFQQDGAPSHTANLTIEWMALNIPDYLQKGDWPPNSPDLNVMDYYVWGAMEARLAEFETKPLTIAELKARLLATWDEVPLFEIRRAIAGWPNRLQRVIECDGGHFEYAL